MKSAVNAMNALHFILNIHEMFPFTSSEISYFEYVVKSGAMKENPSRFGYLTSVIDLDVSMSFAPAAIEL